MVKDIVPNGDVPRMASINDTGDELQYAGHADVKWTIEPISEDHGRHVFEGIAPDAIPPPAPDDGWRWVDHDLRRYAGQRTLVEFTAAGPDFAVAAVI